MKRNLIAIFTLALVALLSVSAMAKNTKQDTIEINNANIKITKPNQYSEMMFKTLPVVSEEELKEFIKEKRPPQIDYNKKHQFIIESLKYQAEKDPANAEKYQTLSLKYNWFLGILKEEDLTAEQTVNGKTEFVLNEYGEQRIYVVLDDIAKAINNLPSEQQKQYTELLRHDRYEFPALNKFVNIAYLYNISKGAIKVNGRPMGNKEVYEYHSAISDSPIVQEDLYAQPLSAK